MLVRPRMLGDLAACVAIAERVHRHDGYPPRLPQNLHTFVASPDALAAWVAVDADEIVGQVVLNPTTSREVMAAVQRVLDGTPVAVVARLLVAPEQRRRGIGQRLLGVAVDEAWCRGRRPILDVAVQFDTAISLYERSGWARMAQVEAIIGDTDALSEYVYLGPAPRASGPISRSTTRRTTPRTLNRTARQERVQKQAPEG